MAPFPVKVTCQIPLVSICRLQTEVERLIKERTHSHGPMGRTDASFFDYSSGTAMLTRQEIAYFDRRVRVAFHTPQPGAQGFVENVAEVVINISTNDPLFYTLLTWIMHLESMAQERGNQAISISLRADQTERGARTIYQHFGVESPNKLTVAEVRRWLTESLESPRTAAIEPSLTTAAV